MRKYAETLFSVDPIASLNTVLSSTSNDISNRLVDVNTKPKEKQNEYFLILSELNERVKMSE
jgi:hypothetical protein